MPIDPSLMGDPARSPLAPLLRRIDDHPALTPPDLGPTLVIAPHADDESLGCGAAIAGLVDAGIAVTVVVVSDGSKSHPNSRRYPAEALRSLREAEATEAVLALAGSPGRVGLVFLRLPDAAVPGPGDVGFEVAADRIAYEIGAIAAATVLAPWRRDPHCDHRASHALALAAIARSNVPPRLLEYPIWAHATTDPADIPRPDEVISRWLEASTVLDRKRSAIAAHRSQTTRLIDDDPDGFVLTPAMLAPFVGPREVYLEPQSP